MRRYGKRFRYAMLIIALTIISIIAINLFGKYLLVNGFSSAFTQPGLRQAFELTEFDIKFINLLRIALSILAIFTGYFNLEYNSEMMKLERKERRLLCGC